MDGRKWSLPIELPCEKVKMPMFCVVYGCSDRSTREKEKSLTYNQPTRGSVKYPNHPIQDYLPSQRVEAAITHETNEVPFYLWTVTGASETCVRQE